MGRTSIARLQKRIGFNLLNDPINWEFTLHKHSEGSSGSLELQSSNSSQGSSDEGGLLGLVKNLVRLTGTMGSNRLAKTSGSGGGQTNAYLISVRRIRTIGRNLQDLEEKCDKEFHTNSGKVYLHNPDNEMTYCGAKALYYCMKISGKGNY